jgi:hypothetical protein
MTIINLTTIITIATRFDRIIYLNSPIFFYAYNNNLHFWSFLKGYSCPNVTLKERGKEKKQKKKERKKNVTKV